MSSAESRRAAPGCARSDGLRRDRHGQSTIAVEVITTLAARPSRRPATGERHVPTGDPSLSVEQLLAEPSQGVAGAVQLDKALMGRAQLIACVFTLVVGAVGQCQGQEGPVSPALGWVPISSPTRPSDLLYGRSSSSPTGRTTCGGRDHGAWVSPRPLPGTRAVLDERHPLRGWPHGTDGQAA